MCWLQNIDLKAAEISKLMSGKDSLGYLISEKHCATKPERRRFTGAHRYGSLDL